MVYRALKLFSPSDPSDAVRLFPSSPDTEPLEKFGAQVPPLVCHPLGSLGVWSEQGGLLKCTGLPRGQSRGLSDCRLHCGNRRSVFIEWKEAEEMRVSQS